MIKQISTGLIWLLLCCTANAQSSQGMPGCGNGAPVVNYGSVGVPEGCGKGTPSTPAYWTPKNLGANGLAWFDPTNTSLITLNSGNISAWQDTLNGNIISQTTAVNQPGYSIAGVHGLNAYNGSSGVGYLTQSTGGIAIPLQNGGVVSFSQSVAGASSQYINGSDPNGVNRVDTGITSGGAFTYNYSNGDVSVGSGLAGAGHILAVYSVSGTITPRIDGTSFATTTTPDVNSTPSIGIGSYAQLNVINWNGYIGDVIFLTSPSLDMIQKSEGYLAWKWGVVSNLPSGHPYKSRPPYVGDP